MYVGAINAVNQPLAGSSSRADEVYMQRAPPGFGFSALNTGNCGNQSSMLPASNFNVVKDNNRQVSAFYAM